MCMELKVFFLGSPTRRSMASSNGAKQAVRLLLCHARDHAILLAPA